MRCTAPKTIIVTIILFVYGTLPLRAQVDSTRRTDVGRFINGVYHNLTAPLHWDKKDWTTTAMMLASTAAISSFDQPVNKYWLGKQDPFLDVVSDVGYRYGHPSAGFILTGGFYLSGVVFKNEWARETGVILGTAFATSTVLLSILKPVVGRTRQEMIQGILLFTLFRLRANFILSLLDTQPLHLHYPLCSRIGLTTNHLKSSFTC